MRWRSRGAKTPPTTSPAAEAQAFRSAPRLALNPTWIAVLPLGVWALLAVYFPVLGGTLTPLQTWTAAGIIFILAAASLVGHTAAHVIFARQGGLPLPQRLPLLVLGDAAQAWSAAGGSWPVAGAAASGPVFNLIAGGAASLLWNAQLGPVLNASLLFTAAFNFWLAAVNLLPIFPFDGGRLSRALLGWAGAGRLSAKLPSIMGYLAAVAVGCWGLLLFWQHARFSLETAGATLFFALLAAAGQLLHPPAGPSPAVRPAAPLYKGRTAAALLALLALSLPAAGFLLTNDGLDAPGLALAVEPMISVPEAVAHRHRGSFLLTSVLSQAPIFAGEWAASRFDPHLKIVPAEQIVPADTTLQEQARQGYQQLDDSEAAAVAVGLRLAGYSSTISGTGAAVISILAASPARSLLQPGDVITALDGAEVSTAVDLTAGMKTKTGRESVRLRVMRGGSLLEITAPLMPSGSPGGPPRLGISILTAGLEVTTPFPVRITPQKIVGGPSAGLMFALTVVNWLSPTDLTGGRRIAGTGTINPDGSVGPIGGVAQKVAAAEAAGAEYFLSPVENYPDARAAARKISVVEIATAQQAVDFLRSLPPAGN